MVHRVFDAAEQDGAASEGGIVRWGFSRRGVCGSPPALGAGYARSTRVA